MDWIVGPVVQQRHEQPSKRPAKLTRSRFGFCPTASKLNFIKSFDMLPLTRMFEYRVTIRIAKKYKDFTKLSMS